MPTRPATFEIAKVWLWQSRTTLHSSHTTSTSAGCGRITVERRHSGASFPNARDGARGALQLQQQTGSTRLDPSGATAALRRQRTCSYGPVMAKVDPRKTFD